MKNLSTFDRSIIKTDTTFNEVWSMANNVDGLDWNYFIAPYLDRDLHEKLLAVTTQEMKPILDKLLGVLILISSGYFYTASLLVQQLDVSASETLTEIKTWLLKSLAEADDT